MLLESVHLIVGIVHDIVNGTDVLFVRNRHVAVTWHVETIQLVHQLNLLLGRHTVVNRDHAHASLLKELNVGLWDVGFAALCAWVSILRFGEHVSSNWLSQDTYDWSATMLNRALGVLQLVSLSG